MGRNLIKNARIANQLSGHFYFGILAILLTYLTFQVGFRLERSQFVPLLLHYAVFFVLYVFVCKTVRLSKWLSYYLVVAILLRLMLVFAFPNLSDDVYRFVWDGRLLVNGYNPFDHLPDWYLEKTEGIPGINRELYHQLNSPDYFTVYPPVSQAIFALSVWLSPHSVWGSSVVMKCFLWLFEVGSLWLIIQLLRHFELPDSRVLWYALNPLIIFEICGNLHFEGAMIFFLLLGIWLLVVYNKWQWAAVAIAFSVASKLLPLLLLPFFMQRVGGRWQQLHFRKVFAFLGIIGMTLVALFLPLYSGVFVGNFGASLNLYFQKFEFNASLYYLLRWLGYQWKGYNLIHVLGPALAMVTFGGIIAMTYFEKKVTWLSLFEKMLWAVCLFLVCSPTVHPWYVALPVLFSVFTRFRFPVVWSALIFMTYINYSYAVYFENLWVVFVEYLIVTGFFLVEYYIRHLS